MHTSELITAEIEGRYGFFPSFFAPALAVARRARRAVAPDRHVLPRQPAARRRFKERLFAYLSRLRSCSYCVVDPQLRAARARRRAPTTSSTCSSRCSATIRRAPPTCSAAACRWGAGRRPARYEEARIVALAAHAFMRDDLAEPCLAELRSRSDRERLRAARPAARPHRRLPRLGAGAPGDRLRRRRARPAPPARRSCARSRGCASSSTAAAGRARWRAATTSRRSSTSADDAIIGETLDGTIVSWNQGAERLYGYSAGDGPRRCPATMLVPRRPQPTRRPRSRSACSARRARRPSRHRSRRHRRRAPRRVARGVADPQRLGHARRHLVDRPRRRRAQAARALPADRAPGDARARAVRRRRRDAARGAARRSARAWAGRSGRPGCRRAVTACCSCAAPRSGTPPRWTARRSRRPAASCGWMPARACPAASGRPAQARWVADVTAEPHSRRADEARQDGLHTLLPAAGPRPGRRRRGHRVPQPRGPPARPDPARDAQPRRRPDRRVPRAQGRRAALAVATRG